MYFWLPNLRYQPKDLASNQIINWLCDTGQVAHAAPEQWLCSTRIFNKGGRVIAVGTTSVRTLECISDELGNLKAQNGWTDIFIYPGYVFKIVDGLITNFHLPESTLIMLVSAFSNTESIMQAYRTAVEEGYHFLALVMQCF